MARRRTPRPAWGPAQAVVLALAFAGAASAPALAMSNPTANRSPSAVTDQDCAQAPVSLSCDIDALSDINAARAAEGIRPMTLPTNYETLTPPEQLLVVTNLERIGRGLLPASGLSRGLDAAATAGAQANTDPDPATSYGDTMGSNWAGGFGSPLLVDFYWMYDDGFGSNNFDCETPSAPGCWVHRDTILYRFDGPLGFGAAEVTMPPAGWSMTEIFVGADQAISPGAPDALVGPTWLTLSQSLRPTLSATSLVASSRANSQLQVTAAQQGITVTAATTNGWQVSPASCQLSPGASCTLKVARPAGAPSSGRLTVTGPAGSSSVRLSSGVAPQRRT